MDFPQISEIDINPFAVDSSGGVILDAKILLDSAPSKDSPYLNLVIHPYPQHALQFTLNNGKRCTIRAVKPEDENLEKEMFASMSEETQSFRFFTVIKEITHDLLVRYTQIDYDRELALVAIVDEPEGVKMAGAVRLQIVQGETDIAQYDVLLYN